MRILVLNAGSSSLKGSVVEEPGERTLASAETDRGVDASRSGGAREAVAELLEALGGAGADVEAVGHRVVHGGTRFRDAVEIDDDVLGAIRALTELAPLHNAVAAETIAAARELLPGVAQVACFDTAFHASLPEEAAVYPLPWAWYAEWGIRRFGFHGLSVAWSVRRAAELLGRPAASLRLVVAHLGSGCSVTAVEGGRSADTSMGYTPLEGLMMGTRAGSVDPGVLLAALRDRGLTPDQLADVLDHGSGFVGLAGTAGGARSVEAAAERGDARASLALAVFARRAAAGIAAAASSLPALDGLVLTGGIGEHSARIPADVTARLGVLGVPAIDQGRADGGDAVLAPGPPAVLRVTAREDLVIAEQVARLVRT
ncbi:MAG TPA: acetate/propionate family kinase [Candidatus Limnocylindria bacterium]|nr:acetate/propionate family kinase [Candidatus Limnocylindria bacterium]